MSVNLLMMDEELYGYLDEVSDREPAALRALREETMRDPRFNMAVSPMEGQFLSVLVRMLAPKKICEVGVYTGYSSLSMALALPPGVHIWCFDVSEPWTAVAKKHWKAAGVDGKITLRLAPGDESMKWLLGTGHAGTFDLVFIDADKPSYHKYWDLAHALLRKGGTVIADNTMFQGFVGPSMTDAEIRGKLSTRTPDIQQEIVNATHAIRAFNKRVHADARFAISLVPVGDGMTFGVKL
jgi:predicted O-methyltransferase YrrM